MPREDRVLLLQVATCAVAYVTDPILSLVDTAFVSRLGTVPLAAMGPNNTVYSNIIGVIAAASFSTAATRLVAQSLTGRQGEVTDPHKMVTCIAATTFGLGLAVAAALLASPEFYLNLVGCKAAIRGPALEYFRIRAAGVPFGLLLLGLQGCYHAATDTVTPLVAVLASGALNGVLDPFLMFTCGLGVAGAAAATVAAQVAAAGWLAYRVFWGRDRRTFGFDRPPVPPTLPASVITGVSTENVWRNLYEWDQWQHAWSRYSASAWQSLVPHLHVFQAYLAETAAFMARAVQIVLVWSLTATFAAYCGIPETAAHQLVLSLFVFQCNLMTAYTTIGTVVAARGMASSSLEKVARVANRLTVYALATAGLLAAGTIAGRHALIAFFTRDPLVVAPATTAMVSAAGMVAISVSTCGRAGRSGGLTKKTVVQGAGGHPHRHRGLEFRVGHFSPRARRYHRRSVARPLLGLGPRRRLGRATGLLRRAPRRLGGALGLVAGPVEPGQRGARAQGRGGGRRGGRQAQDRLAGPTDGP